MEPVDPTIEIGLGPSHVLRPESTTAVPGQAEGGPFAEHWTLLAALHPLSFLFKAKLPENNAPCISMILASHTKYEPNNIKLDV